MCGSQETAKELDLGIEIDHGWFMERGNSILSIFCCELAITSVATELNNVL